MPFSTVKRGETPLKNLGQILLGDQSLLILIMQLEINYKKL